MNAALVDRDAFRDLLDQHDLGAHADALIAEIASPAFLLLPAEGITRSRLGGPPLLPPEEDWPRSRGHALTFLAAIDFAEVPPNDTFPADGWLLFFAELTGSGLDGGSYDAKTAEEGQPSRLYFALAPEIVDAPDDLAPGARLKERSITFEPVLGLRRPNPDDDWQSLGLSVQAAHRYEDLVLELLGEAIAWRPGELMAAHWLGGAPADAQGYSPPPNKVVLLHLSSDERLDLMISDGGTITFVVNREALAATDFSGATAHESSG